MRVLTVFDAHVEPGQDLSRFDALGNFIAEKKPNIIVDGGDFSSIGSLSDWDSDKRRKMELRRYANDIEATNEAINRMYAPLVKLQSRARRHKAKMYRPRKVKIQGNHEYRVDRYLDYNPVMEGTIDYSRDISFGDVEFSEYSYIPFMSPHEQSASFINGVAFTHGPRNRAGLISSKYVSARALADAFECSVVFGHTHRFVRDSLLRVRGDGSRPVHVALNGGCFFEDIPEYALNNANDYYPCVLILDLYEEGKFRIEEEVPLDLLKKEYL